MYSFEGVDGATLHLDAEHGQIVVTVSDPDSPVAAAVRFDREPADGDLDLSEAVTDVARVAWQQYAEIANQRDGAMRALLAGTTARDDLVDRLRRLVESGAVQVDTDRVELGHALVASSQVLSGRTDPNNS